MKSLNDFIPALQRALKIAITFTFLASVPMLSLAQTISFTPSSLNGEVLSNPTSLQFGPDGRLYVAQQNGIIFVYTIAKNGPNDYQVTSTEVITHIMQIPNHNDDGTPATTVNTRQVTGILVVGTAQNPVIYVTSSDPRHGGGFNAVNQNLDTNSGMISRLTWDGTEWDHLELVRGLPRSEENHSINGLTIDEVNNVLYVAQGSNTNMGAPSNNFVMLSEYAYSTAILKVDLNAIGETPYNLPTLDDEDRANVNAVPGYEDDNDPFGGNNGKNQAVLVPDGPVQIYSPGWRNNYDIVITKTGNNAGKMYSFDNGPNAGWGGAPTGCNNQQSEPGVTYHDVLIHVSGPGHYAGSPNPTRANRANTFNPTNPQTPIPLGMENPIECNYVAPGSKAGELGVIQSSTNGLCEYTASNFNNAMKGDLIAAAFNGNLYRFKLNETGDALIPLGGTTPTGQPILPGTLASGFGTTPLDVIAQGDNDIFPGTIWCATYGSGNITIFEPSDAPPCAGELNSMLVDNDGDGYMNGDETQNGTDPCNPSSKPKDFDGDLISDLNDPDDDNDGINDEIDQFALDFHNGMNTPIPVSFDFDNSDDGGIENWGFTGLMINGTSNYRNLYNPTGMTVGGAALKFTVDAVSAGEAHGSGNNQQNAFQFGVDISNTQWNYIAHTRIMGPYSGFTPVNFQSMGMYIGTGDQDNFLRIICHSNNGAGGIQVLKEEGGIPAGTVHSAPILNSNYVDFFLNINPSTLLVQPSYSINGGDPFNVGPPIAIPSDWISQNALAVGIISSSNSPLNGPVAPPFPATWDFIKVYYDQSNVTGQWHTINSSTHPTERHECAYVHAGNKFFLLGGRGSQPVQCYHPNDSTWETRSAPPVQIHHFQAVEYNGLIYAMCGFTGNFPNETPLANIYIYDPVGDTWTVGPEIPANRRRGSAGCVVHNDKIYVICGIQNGHIDGWVPWVDEYDPLTNTWTPLPDAPRERDHFSVAIVNGKIYCIGGRKTGFGGSTFSATVPQVDIFNIGSNVWTSLPSPSGDLPTPRAAASVGVIGNEILVIGGESSQLSAHNETEALNFITNSWREVASLNVGRHGTQAIVSNGNIYVASGSKSRGNDEINSQEVFYFFNPSPATGTEIVKGNLTPSTTTKNFSLVILADTKTSSVNITNTGGNQVLVVHEITLTDTANYRIINYPNLPIAIAPNHQFALNIEFHPLSLGIKNANIHIEHTGANGPVDIGLTGESVETIPCEVNPTEQNGLLVFECELAQNLPATWKVVTDISGYTGTAFLRYEGQDFFNNPGNQSFTYKINITNPGRYRFQQRSRQYGPPGNENNDYWIRFPHGGARKFQFGDDKGPLIGWFKIYQNFPNSWTYQTAAVEENPHDVFVDFDAPGTYEINVSARSNLMMLDRYIFYRQEITEAQATTNLPPASPITCIEVPWYADNDGDLFGTPNDIVVSIAKPSGYVLNNKDCDDTNANIKPSATEIQDGVDNNCNGVVDEGFGAPKVLFVVGNTSLTTADQAIKDRITLLGFDVTVVTGAQATATVAEAMNLVFISSTASPTDVGTKFTSLGTPVINCEPNLMDDLQLTGTPTVNYGSTTSDTQITLKGAPHPLAGNLSNGVKLIFTTANKVVWAKPQPSAIKIAHTIADTTQMAVFGYDNNALMVNMNAPARRVGFFLDNLGGDKLTPDGLALLDAALRWATNYTNIGVTLGDALLVVGNTTLGVGDQAVKTRLEALGFEVTLVSGPASSASSANGMDLVVISSTINSNDVNTKFMNVDVPLMNWEPGLMDDLKLSSSGGSTNTSADKVQIINTSHPMAGGLPLGQVQVYSAASGLIHTFNVGSNAIKIAGTSSNANNLTIFGYEEGVSMVGLTAPARRVGFFLHDLGPSMLTSNGFVLFDAAIRWLTEGLNSPPAFITTGNTTAAEDFTGSKIVAVTPLPPLPGEENQVPTYSLSPSSVSFANVSFSTATGLVTFTSKPNESGTQEFTITADDGQANNNTYSQTFTFTVNSVNDAPTFNVSGNITTLKNFAEAKSVTVTPDPVPSNEASQTVTYSLNPNSVSFANVSINSSTGQVTITSIPDLTGFQIFTITANDGQGQNNTATKQFFLAVNEQSSNALCFNCGGSQYIAVTGDTFKSDFHFSSGTLTYTNEVIPDIQNTFDDPVFRTERNATTFSYNVPVANGVYKVRLYFAETYFGATGGSVTGGAGSRVFHVNLENTQVLSYFDIFAQANGPEKAIMREFSNVAVSDGAVTITLNSVINKAKISGICILPDGTGNNPPSFSLSSNIAEVKNFAGTRSIIVTPDPVQPGETSQVVTYSLTPPSVAFANVSLNNNTGRVDFTSVPDATGFQEFTLTANDGQPMNSTVSRKFYLAVNESRSKAKCWNCGGPQYVSVVGDTFQSDFHFTSGAFTFTNNSIQDIQNTFDDFVFRSERNADSFGYNIPVANGLYKLKLLFAEIHFQATGGSATGGAGSRVFDVSVEGALRLDNFDIFAAALGAEKAVIREFDSLQINDGVINIWLKGVVNKAKISGICIEPYIDNEPPTFSLSSGVINVDEDFVGSQIITVTPDPVPPSDSNDVVTYSISPTSSALANASINANTGTVTITSQANKNGSAVFTVTANDGKPFGTFSRQFTLNVAPINDPPTFTIASNITLAKNFSPPSVIQVTPTGPADEAGQVVTYSISPPTSSLVNVSINSSTGAVTFTSIQNQYGSQQFTVFANDGQLVNNIASQNFTLNISQFSANQPLPKHINCGGPQFITLAGDTFKTDNFFTSPSFTFTNNSIPDILNTTSDALYRTERYSGTYSYNIPVNNGMYDISLHFAEVYYGATGGQPANGGPGKRLFHIDLEGTRILTNYDIWVEAGGAERAVIETFSNVSISDGVVNIALTAVVANAKLSAISIVPSPVDCNGDSSGTAFFNSCGVCVEGNTGLPIDAGRDCAGVCGGTAFVNTCEICVEGTTGLPANSGLDCNGDCNGTAFINDCNICVGGNTGLSSNQGKDCAGVCGGEAVLNDCNICIGGTTGLPANEGKDCEGVCNGTAFLNDCGHCVSGTTGLTADHGKDCAGACNGTAALDDCGICSGGTSGHIANSDKDACGVCFGNGSSCGPGNDCAGIPNGAAFVNSCGICVGGTTGLPSNQGQDCAGTCNGTAALDDCGICSGGTSGHIANSDKDACGVCFGNGSSCGSCVPNEVVSFTLMNAGTAGEIGPLTSGMTINKATIGSFSIRANACNGQNVGSVKFILNGTTFRTESAAPYALNGDSPTGNYVAWNPNVGSYTLTATPYTGASGSGTAGVSETVTFTVINQVNQNDCAGVLNGSAFVNSCGICVGGTTGLPASQGQDCNGACNGTAFINECGICVGGNTGKTANHGKDCAGVCSGTAFLDDCGVCSGGTSGHVANSDKDVCGVCFGNGECPTCVPNEVVSFSLVHAGTAGEIGMLTDGMVINKASIGSFSIRANTCNGQNVGSVKFILNGATVKIESIAPYAINGDTPVGSYVAWNPAVGSYTLTATPYTGASGSGTAGVSETITLTVINQVNQNDCAGVLNGSAFVNSCGICVGGTTGLPITQGQDCNGTCNGTAFLNDCGICVGGNTGKGINHGKDCMGLCNGEAFIDDCGVCSGGTSGHVANSDKDICGVCFGNGSGSGTGPSYLKTVNPAKSWRKLKLGYSSTGLFTPKNNVTESGNNQICITMRDPLGTAEWSKIQVRPQANSTTFAVLGNYVPAQPGTGWFTVCIPLSVFPAVNFTELTMMELPYSNGANPFEIHIQKIEFTGGSAPFLFFGDPKTDNYHDGNTNSSMVTQLVQGSNCGGAKTSDSALLAEAEEFGFKLYPNPNTGTFMLDFASSEQADLSIRIFNHLGQVIYSDQKLQFTGKLNEQITLNAMPSGMYYMQMLHGEKRMDEKIIVRD